MKSEKMEIYRCMNCGKINITHPMDGMRCKNCKGAMTIITTGEIIFENSTNKTNEIVINVRLDGVEEAIKSLKELKKLSTIENESETYCMNFECNVLECKKNPERIVDCEANHTFTHLEDTECCLKNVDMK